MSSYQERIAAIDAEVAELRRIIEAPRRLSTLMAKRRDLEHRLERLEQLDVARTVAPDYDQRLEDARAAVVAAQADVDAHEARRQASGRIRGKAPVVAAEGVGRGATGETIVIGNGIVTGKQPVLPRYLPAPTLAHRIAIEQLDQAKSRVKRLERFPAALAEGGDQPAGESASDRIRNAPKIPLGERLRLRRRHPAYEARIAEAMGEDGAA